MSGMFEFNAEVRDLAGTGSSRAVRRQGGVPAVIYGGDSEPVMLKLVHNEVVHHLEREAVYSHILDINVDGKIEKAVLKAVQRHPAKPVILHMDFLRIDENHKIKVNVPLHFIGADIAVGVKKGGVVTHNFTEVEVSCLAANLPEFLEIDLTDLDLSESAHLSDIQLPEGVAIVELAHGELHDQAVAGIVAVRGGASDDDEETEESAESE